MDSLQANITRNVEKNIETVQLKYFSSSATGTETKKFWFRANLFMWIRGTTAGTRVKHDIRNGRKVREKKELRSLVTA